MTAQFHRSPALVTFHQGEHIQDVQILIDDPEVFNLLPGKHERYGIKTITSTPIFVTVVLNPKALMPDEEAHSIRDDDGQQCSQIPIFDLTLAAPPKGEKHRKRKVDRTLAEIRRLYDELNIDLRAKPTERPIIHSPGDAFLILQPSLGPLDHEELWVMNLDTRNRVMSLNKLYQGSVNASQVRVAEVFRQAIIDNSPAVILAHNHPSGDPAPSPEDVAVTRAVVQVGKLLDIDVLDHIVVTVNGYASLKERGLGF
jgi:hypothetical protein